MVPDNLVHSSDVGNGWGRHDRQCRKRGMGCEVVRDSFCGVLVEHSCVVEVWTLIGPGGLCNAAPTMGIFGLPDSLVSYPLLSLVFYLHLSEIGLDLLYTMNPLSA